MRLVRSWAACSKHQPALCQGLGEDPTPCLSDGSGVGRSTAPFFLGFQDPEEAERLGLGDCFPKGRIPGERKLIYGFI